MIYTDQQIYNSPTCAICKTLVIYASRQKDTLNPWEEFIFVLDGLFLCAILHIQVLSFGEVIQMQMLLIMLILFGLSI